VCCDTLLLVLVPAPHLGISPLSPSNTSPPRIVRRLTGSPRLVAHRCVGDHEGARADRGPGADPGSEAEAGPQAARVEGDGQGAEDAAEGRELPTAERGEETESGAPPGNKTGAGKTLTSTNEYRIISMGFNVIQRGKVAPQISAARNPK
jgi:hypothetical protein